MPLKIIIGVIKQHNGVVVAIILAVVVVDLRFYPPKVHFVIRRRHQKLCIQVGVTVVAIEKDRVSIFVGVDDLRLYPFIQGGKPPDLVFWGLNVRL